MYGGLDKFGGGIVGATDGLTENLEEAMLSSSIEETLVVPIDVDGSGVLQNVLLEARVNPEGGGLMWVGSDDSQRSYKMAIASSQMTSMLRDVDRNRKYNKAIEKAVKSFLEENAGRPPVVFDLGAGTGLLSMMAARAGAQKVIGCEVFPTLAELAQIISTKNCGETVTILPKLSTHVKVGSPPDHNEEAAPLDSSSHQQQIEPDMPDKADILVTEILDSALLGEGMLPYSRQVLRDLLKPGARVVPQGAHVVASLVQCEGLRQCHDLSRLKLPGGVTLMRDEASSSCHGGRTSLPMHIAEISPPPFPLTKEEQVLSFDFQHPSEEPMLRTVEHVFEITSEGECHAVLFWWSVALDEETTYSTRPGDEGWQDHWVQMVYPLSPSLQVQKGDRVLLRANHDDVHIWFEAELPDHESKKKKPKKDLMEESCGCGWHALCNSERLLMLNDHSRNEHYYEAIREVVHSCCQQKEESSSTSSSSSLSPSDLVVLDVSDGPLCALFAASLGVGVVLNLETKPFSQIFSEQLALANGVSDSLIVLSGPMGAEDVELTLFEQNGRSTIDALVGEPYFFQMHNQVLWQAVNFWYLRTSYQSLFSPSTKVVPARARYRAVAVEFKNLTSGFGKVGVVEGFDHSDLDAWQEGWHQRWFPYPLWMYPFRPLTDPFDVLCFDYSKEAASISTPEGSGLEVPIIADGICHGTVLWVDYDLDDAHTVSTGPFLGDYGVASQFSPKYWKQSVQFTGNPTPVVKGAHVLQAHGSFVAEGGDLQFSFVAVSSPQPS